MKKVYFLFLVPALLFSSIAGFVRAEEDDDEDRYENESRSTNDQASDSEPSQTKTKTVKQTIIISPAKMVTENITQDILLSDKDFDGIPDSEDPHPDIAEIYMVSDDNLNGIVDDLENKMPQ